MTSSKNICETYDKYKNKRVEGEALQNLDEAPESEGDLDKIWEVVSVHLEHNPMQEITSPINLPTDKNEYHEPGILLMQHPTQTTSSSSARKDLTQQFEQAGGDLGTQATGGGSTGENK